MANPRICVEGFLHQFVFRVRSRTGMVSVGNDLNEEHSYQVDELSEAFVELESGEGEDCRVKPDIFSSLNPYLLR